MSIRTLCASPLLQFGQTFRSLRTEVRVLGGGTFLGQLLRSIQFNYVGMLHHEDMCTSYHTRVFNKACVAVESLST